MMSDKTLQDRLREPDWWMDDTLNEEAADHIDALEERIAGLEAESEKLLFSHQWIADQARKIDVLSTALQKVADADFDLSLHKQHDILSYLKHMAKEALAKLDGDA